MDVPVTLKIRTGWSPEERNCVTIAQLAERCGIQALTIHGRTAPVCLMVKPNTTTSGQLSRLLPSRLLPMATLLTRFKARAVLDYTGADALMIGRAAQGRPGSSGNPALSGHGRRTVAALPVQRGETHNVRTCGIARLLRSKKGARIARKHVSGICRNMHLMFSFGAHSTPLRMPANSWRRWRHIFENFCVNKEKS